MANADLQVFLENRLRALDPTIDLDPGSPAQVQFIEPVLTYLGTDPFETDINSFIADRFAQEFPDIFVDDPGVVRDVFIKPLLLLLEPFKREIQFIKKNQSLKDPTILSDDDADALVANVFDERSPGGFSVGTARLFYANPTNVQIEITNRVFTVDGLGFFPTNPISITAEEMVFNKSGTQYFLDVPLKAESQGSQYNIDVGALSGVDGLFGVVRVTNLQKFNGGASIVDTPTFVASAREAMNERSLVTRRGATARLTDVFQTELRAVQVIGAKDAEMERDILVATSPGHAWIEGPVSIYQQVALVQAKIIDGEETDAPVAGDTLFVYLSKTAYPAVPQASRFVRLKVEEVLIGPLTASTPYQMLYLIRFSGSFPSGVVPVSGETFDGGLSKKGNIQISSLPDIGAVNVSAANGTVHVFGHTDFYVRPILQPASTAVFSGLKDSDSFVERLTLQTFGLTTEKNKVQDPGLPAMDFVATGVVAGDLLSVETGDDVGVYVILNVTSSTLYLNANLTNSQSNIRYRILKNINVDQFEPKITKFPFGSLLANDLQTIIGSNLFELTTNDIVGFGAQIGDTLRVTTGIAAGDYIITGFDTVLGGKGPIVDRVAPGTSSNALYSVFSPLESIQKPLVRLKDLSLLDSSKQSTGISIPYGLPVASTPVSNFTSAKVRASSSRASGFILPSFATTALTTYLSGASTAAPSGDRRYSLGFDIPVGIYHGVQFPDTSFAELDYHADPAGSTGDALDPCSYFVSVVEESDESENFPPIDPKPGDSLSIKNGPNKGDYLIKSIYKFKHKLSAPARTLWTYFVKIYGKFPVDVFGQLFDFLNSVGGGASIVELPISGTVAYPTYYVNLYNSLGTKLNSALTTLGVPVPPSAGTLQSAVDQMSLVQYDWGDPARGTLRTFMLNPTLVSQNTAESPNPTLFSYTTPAGDVVKFRPDPFQYQKQEVIPARLTQDSDATAYPRDLDVAITLAYNTQTSNFTVGKNLTGGTSGATATIIADVDGGATGTLTLSNVVGAFIIGEIITDNNGVPGSATAGAVGTTTTMTFTDPTRATVFALGVVPGDYLSYHEEIFFHGTDNSRQTAIQTVAGSTQLTAPTTSGNIFTSDMVGNLLFIESGQDKGAYRVVKFIDGKNILIDKAMTESTPTILLQGPVTSWGYDGVGNVINSGVIDFAPYIGKFITIYGLSYKYQGSFAIASAPILGTARFTRIGNLPFPVTMETDAHFVVTNAPSTTPTTVLSGTELYGLRPIRMYESASDDVRIASVVYNDLSVSRITVDASPAVTAGLSQPFRIYRKNVRRVTPSEMAVNVFGETVFFDTDVVSFSPQESANVSSSSYLTTDQDTYQVVGYTHKVDDRTLTYSMKETGTLVFPARILPVGSADSLDNFINLVGSSVQITYEQSDLVRRIQEFADSAQDRVTSANLLARHFLPAYVSYSATYTGGSAPSVIAGDIIDYINNLAVETPIDVSEIQDLLARRGANPTTPTYVQSLSHDWGRNLWLEFSADQLGGTTSMVPYDGTPRVSFFIPGPDVSGQSPVPSGEKISLVRL